MKHFFKYNLIGVINTLFSYGVIFSFMHYLNFTPALSNFFGYLFGITLSFYLNKKFNFKTINKANKEFALFVFAIGISYLCNLATLHLLIVIFKINPYIAQIFSGVVYIIISFSFCKFLVFRTATA
jgi:putative flippase GtrA